MWGGVVPHGVALVSHPEGPGMGRGQVRVAGRDQHKFKQSVHPFSPS